jgi:hypothetical protein
MADLTSNELCNICCKHYCVGLRCCALGSIVPGDPSCNGGDGGRLIYKQGSVAWIVAPAAAEVSRGTSNKANDGILCAETVTGVSGWFVPSKSELLLGFSNREHWDSYSQFCYYSSIEYTTLGNWHVNMRFGSFASYGYLCFSCIRAFRKVFY